MNDLDSPIKHFSLTDTEFFMGKSINEINFYKEFFKSVRRKHMFKLTPSALKRKITIQKIKIESNIHIKKQSKIKHHNPFDNIVKIV